MEDDSYRDLAYARSLGERLRAARRQRGLSLEAVDRASNREFKDSALSSYERGDRAISVPRLRRLAELYGTTVDELLPQAGVPERAKEGEATIDLRATQAMPPEVDVTARAIERLQDLVAVAEEVAQEAERMAVVARSVLGWLGTAAPRRSLDGGQRQGLQPQRPLH